MSFLPDHDIAPAQSNWLVQLAVMLAFILVPAAGRAQAAKYLIDHPIDECRALLQQGDHAVLAYSISQASGCTYGTGDMASFRANTIALCTRNTPVELRAKAPCRIISEDNRIVASKFVSSLRRPQRAPVALEIYDETTGKVQTATGYISQGKYVTLNSIPTQLVLSSGLVLCNGTTHVGFLSFSFSATCFGKGPFSGNVRPTGTVYFEGLYRPAVSFTIKDGKSYIKGRVVSLR